MPFEEASEVLAVRGDELAHRRGRDSEACGRRRLGEALPCAPARPLLRAMQSLAPPPLCRSGDIRRCSSGLLQPTSVYVAMLRTMAWNAADPRQPGRVWRMPGFALHGRRLSVKVRCEALTRPAGLPRPGMP